MTRLSPTGRILIVNTRWSVDDLCGWILREHPAGWSATNLPALAEPDDILGRSEGTPLWPERFSREYLESQREMMGTRDFGALFQGRPAPAGGNIFRLDRWKYFDEIPPLESVTISVDTAFSAKQTADFSVAEVWATAPAGFFLLDLVRKRVEYPKLERIVVALAEKYSPRIVLIEEKGSGQSLLQSLQRNTRLPVVGAKANADKVTRANLVSALHEAGRLFLPSAAPWLADFLDETENFPASSHDDMTDAMVHALLYLRGTNTGPARIEIGTGITNSRVFDLRHGDSSSIPEGPERDAFEDEWNARQRRGRFYGF
jgi:predicted phage terminase large subunit-like protein